MHNGYAHAARGGVAREKYTFLYTNSYELTFCKGLLRTIVIYIYTCIHVTACSDGIFVFTESKRRLTKRITLQNIRSALSGVA